MSLLYFTSNASTGAGSLAEAVKNAQPGDVIRPDETVFERGATIEIALASTLTIDKNLTLDASPFRVVLNGDGLPRCCDIASGVNIEITAFRFVGGGWNSRTGAAVGTPDGAGIILRGDSNATLNRCEFYGCRGMYGGAISCSVGSTTRLNDCVVAGCAASGAGGGVRSRGVVEIYGSTIVGGVGAGGDVFVDASGAGRVTLINSIVGTYSGNVEIGPGCVVGVAPSALGFVAPPPDDLTLETWDANAWQSWNLRLLDDASPNPSPYRDSGDVDAASKYDLDGNFRGRETNGAATRSPGAYETIQADLFWIGRDATGAEVVSPSFLTSDGWAASRFATVSGDAAPQIGRSVFVDGNVHFVDVLSTTSAQTFGLTVGGAAVAAIDAVSRVYFGKLQIALGASFTATSSVLARTSTRCGAWSRINSQFNAEKPCDFDVKSYIANAVFYAAYIPNAASYGSLMVATSTVDLVRLSGEYVCDAFSTVQNGTATDQTIKVGDDGATIRARQFRFGVDDAANYVESFFDRPVTLKLQGAASVSTPSTFRESWADNFLIDASEATSVNVIAAGQRTCHFSHCDAIFGGQVRIVNEEAAPKSLDVLSDSTLNLDAATLRLQSLATRAGSRIDGRGRLVFPSNGRWINEGATINGVPAEDYDAASNDIKIVYEFDASEIRNAFSDGVCRWTSEALDAGTLPFVFGKYSLDAQGKGDYRTIYDSTQPIDDATAPVYETASDWDDETLKTVVHATPETGWNFYRVKVPPFANLGGAKIYHGGQTTRYFVVWNADYEPERTYHYCGGATGSFTTPSDWALTADGIAKFEGAPITRNSTFVLPVPAELGDCPDDHLQIQAVYPYTINVYNASGRRLSDAEARLVSVGVPTPSALEFYVGKGGTSGFWTQCDGATLYRVEAVDGSATGLTTSNRWLDANELKAKTWRVRVAAPIYGGVEKWSTQTTAVQPFSALVEKPSYDDANAGNAFELVYADEFDGVRDATVERSHKSDAASTILTRNFAGGEFTDVPETFDEYVYRVSWTPSPENVWLETTAAPWFVADGFDAKTQTNFITTPSRAYETPTFAARIEKKSNGELLKRQDVAKISYSLFETRDHWATRAERLAVGPDGSYWRHDVEIPAATVRDSLLVDPNFWSLDEIGANFVFSPRDGRPFFPGPGAYLVRATLETTNGRRIVVEFPTQVE